MRGSPVDVEQQWQPHVHAPATHINNPPPQTVPVYIVGGVTPARELPCGGLGLGWTLFIVGIFLGTIPWYIGAFMLCCGIKDEPREKPGCTACLIAAILATVLIAVWIFTSAI